MTKEHSNGATAGYYQLPEGATQLQDLISHLNLNAQIGEIFRACYRYGRVSHSDELRDARKILFYAKAEVERLEKLQAVANEKKEFPNPLKCVTCKHKDKKSAIGSTWCHDCVKNEMGLYEQMDAHAQNVAEPIPADVSTSKPPLKVGQVWKDRAGNEIELDWNTGPDWTNTHPFLQKGGTATYTKDGIYSADGVSKDHRNLIELIRDVA